MANTFPRPPLQQPDAPTWRWAKRPGDLDHLTLKVVSVSRVTWATSVPILVFLGLCSRLRPDVRDRQTSDSIIDLCPRLLGRWHNNRWNGKLSTSQKLNYSMVRRNAVWNWVILSIMWFIWLASDQFERGHQYLLKTVTPSSIEYITLLTIYRYVCWALYSVCMYSLWIFTVWLCRMILCSKY